MKKPNIAFLIKWILGGVVFIIATIALIYKAATYEQWWDSTVWLFTALILTDAAMKISKDRRDGNNGIATDINLPDTGKPQPPKMRDIKEPCGHI